MNANDRYDKFPFMVCKSVQANVLLKDAVKRHNCSPHFSELFVVGAEDEYFIIRRW